MSVSSLITDSEFNHLTKNKVSFPDQALCTYSGIYCTFSRPLHPHADGLWIQLICYFLYYSSTLQWCDRFTPFSRNIKLSYSNFFDLFKNSLIRLFERSEMGNLSLNKIDDFDNIFSKKRKIRLRALSFPKFMRSAKKLYFNKGSSVQCTVLNSQLISWQILLFPNMTYEKVNSVFLVMTRPISKILTMKPYWKYPEGFRKYLVSVGWGHS